MDTFSALDAIPLSAFFVFTLLLVLLAIEGGYRLGRFRGARTEHEKEAPVGAMVAAMLGLLAFILAFTFSLAAQRFDTRRQVLLDEANAIGTTYLRAAMLPQQEEEIRALLRDYVDVRLAAAQDGGIAEGIRKSEELQNRVWAHAVALARDNPDSIVVGLFVQSLNEMIDLHAKRITAGIRNRVPAVIWFALFAVAVISLGAMGYHAGLVRTSRSLAIVAVGVTFTVVIGLVADLDSPREGFLKVSQQALVDLRESMKP
ncbi:MAG TPA: hypothetical protein VMV37_15265 [Gammaproteobacteria bacterium]|nr:hypothetical protein [Gammaproteobacteria bacterium]